MHFETPAVIFFAVFAIIVGSFAYKALKYGGFKAAMLGGRIEQTVGEVKGIQRGANVRLRIHSLLDDDGDRMVGIELVATTIGSYQMLPITLSERRAKELIALVQEALSDAPEVT